MKILVLAAILIGGCARLGAGLSGFSRGVQSAQNASKHRQVCRPSPYASGEIVCEDE